MEQLAEECVAEITGGTQVIIASVREADAGVIRSYTENIIHAAAKARDQICFLLEYGARPDFAGGIVNFLISWLREPGITEEEAIDILCAIHTPPALAAMDYARKSGDEK